VLAEIERANQAEPVSGRPALSTVRSRRPELADALEERIRRDPPPAGVRRFYNTAFKMPERTHGH
jgi:hypothetical protein